MRLAWGVSAVLTTIALAACGGGSSGGTGSGGTYGTPAARVASTFQTATGTTLKTLDDDEVWTTYVPDTGDATALRKYGPFTLYVVKHPGGEKPLLAGSSQDADGLWWKSAGAGLWNLTRRYDTNVYLVVAGLPAKRPDAKYRAIDAALRGL